MVRPKFLIAVVLLLALTILPVSATMFTYTGAGNASSIQDLINNASSGDSIFIAGGTYYGNIILDKPLVFGALDTNNPPVIYSDGSAAGITISADAVTLTGITVEGNSENGIIVLSGNNRIGSNTVRMFGHGLSLRGASNNIVFGNTIVNNTIGIVIDRTSDSNTFYLNELNNTVDAVNQGTNTIWTSARQTYQYNGSSFTGPLGNFWQNAGVTDSNGDGVGDSEYKPETSSSFFAGSTGIADKAPLVLAPSQYTVEKSQLPINATVLNGHLPNTGEAEGGSVAGSQQPFDPSVTGVTRIKDRDAGQGPTGAMTLPQSNPGSDVGPPPDSLFFAIGQLWWVIAGAVIISIIAGIWVERSRKKQKSGNTDSGRTVVRPQTLPGQTVIQKGPAPDVVNSGTPEHQYGATLPLALEKKYPDAQYVAEGGVCRVFKAWDEKENRSIAVKVPIRFDEVTGSQFTKELNVWEGLHHKNIVEIYGANIFPLPYIEMEFVDSSLAAMKFPIPPDKATAIVRGVAEGLAYAHEKGIIHRDIKPENILVTPDGTPKITDWGLSKAEGTKQSGIIGFSLEYASPEQLAPNVYGEPGPWTDIFQLGVLYYEMLAGRVPFSGGGMGEITHAILHDTPEPLALDGRNAEKINAIISRCLQKKPADRYASVVDLIRDLDSLS